MTYATSLLLIHSPVVGPSTWRPLAALATQRGFAVAVPNLTTALDGSTQLLWRRFVEIAVEAAGGLKGQIDICGHSAAGALLPSVGDALGDRLGRLVFVDAVIPPKTGVHATPDRVKDLLDRHTEQGLLKPWLDWWDDDVVRSLIPDRADRDTLRADLPKLPRSYYDEPIPVPDGWWEQGCRYLRLSPAYETELEIARSLGWETAVLNGTHLSMFTEPGVVLDRVGSLVADPDQG